MVISQQSTEYYLAEIIEQKNELANTNVMLGREIADHKNDRESIIKLNEDLERRVIERTAQLEETNKELEAFSYSVSHDLRSPLRHINGFADILSHNYREQLPPEAQAHFNVITGSVHKMESLIDDLLSFSRTINIDVNRSEFKMNSLLKDAMAQILPYIKDRNVVWNISTLPEVSGDYNLLIQVWVNLLGNAVKFTGTREKAVVRIDYSDEKEEFIFSVRDNGVGFDMKYSEKLFGAFQRLHSSFQFEGTGIGLATVRRIISRHHGRTWAESEVDKGATFYFSLPKNIKSVNN